MNIEDLIKAQIAYARTKSANLFQNPDLVRELGYTHTSDGQNPNVAVPAPSPIAAIQPQPINNAQTYVPTAGPMPTPHANMKMVLNKKVDPRSEDPLQELRMLLAQGRTR